MSTEARTSATLGRGSKGEVAQVGSYRTDLFQNIDGLLASAITTAYTYNTIVRVKSYGGDNWVTRTAIAAAAVADTGLLLEDGSEITMLVYAGEQIATIGGKLNIVPVSE